MASVCVNNIGMSADKFPATYPPYGWLSPRISVSREIVDDESSKEFGDFEFRLEYHVTMLPADELFSDGKLVPLQLSTVPQAVTSTVSPEIRSPDEPKARRRLDVSNTDPYLFSPKAPRCSSRWKEIIGLKRLHLNNNAKQHSHKTSSSLPLHSSNNSRSLKNFLHRSSKSTSSAIDTSLILPLLKDSDPESVSISSRLSLSSSSSGHEHDDLPRLSLDSEKPNFSHNPITLTKNPNPNSNLPRVKVVKQRANSSENPTGTRIGGSPLRRAPDSTTTARGASVDSPRMNSSGKIVFQGLERSSSSPSSFNGGPRFNHRGMERSYSANVRVTPVLNVPVCSFKGSSKSSVFGFQIFSSTQKREGGAGNGIGNRGQQMSSSKNRTERS
ncbi:hypothetical protein Acr_00g0095380 [Actinidia rufa]|uniref:Uncharacterized protein n=1 Tax=Actinidia rufa TaxID=165716 RepID=A0A7J0DYB2_9ERIC|nr:hypothetical protein Acr_00g0095380 [Actinidia rufa]